MADTFKTARPGEPLELAAEWKNIGNDVFQAYRRSRKTHSSPPVTLPRTQSTLIRLKNTSGADIDRFNVLKVGVPLFTPTTSLSEFQRVIVHEGPAAEPLQPFAVMLEPLEV